MLGGGLSARVGMCLRQLQWLRPEVPEAGMEAAAATETDRTPAKGSPGRGRGLVRAAVDPREVDREAAQAWAALGLLGAAQEAAQGAVQAWAAVDPREAAQEAVQATAAEGRSHRIRVAVAARILGGTTTRQVEDLTRRAAVAVVATDRIRPGDEC